MDEVLKTNENFLKLPKHHSTPKEIIPDRQERRGLLKTLQASPSGNGLNGGKEKDSHTAVKPNLEKEDNQLPAGSSKSTKLVVYHDPDPLCSRATQTDVNNDSAAPDSAFFDQEAFDLMANDEVPESYWKDLAEERRRALEESLIENEKLTNEVHRLKEENSQLKDIAKEAKVLRQLLEEALPDDDSAVETEDPTQDDDLKLEDPPQSKDLTAHSQMTSTSDLISNNHSKEIQNQSKSSDTLV